MTDVPELRSSTSAVPAPDDAVRRGLRRYAWLPLTVAGLGVAAVTASGSLPESLTRSGVWLALLLAATATAVSGTSKVVPLVWLALVVPAYGRSVRDFDEAAAGGTAVISFGPLADTLLLVGFPVAIVLVLTAGVAREVRTWHEKRAAGR